MGLPLGKLVVGTNENDILARFFSGGSYEKLGVLPSISPSMDICVSSNFERYLFHLFGDDPHQLRQMMEAFESKAHGVGVGEKGGVEKGSESSAKAANVAVGTASPSILTVTPQVLQQANQDFLAAQASTEEVLELIGRSWEGTPEKQQGGESSSSSSVSGYLFCPHTACGVVAASKLGLLNEHMVCLATAHAGKFYDSIKKSSRLVDNPLPPLPPALAAVQTLPMRTTDHRNSLEECQEVVLERCGLKKKQKKEEEEESEEGGAIAITNLFTTILPLALGLGFVFFAARRR
jgi:threonine synthase